jgi:hypothetical protein
VPRHFGILEAGWGQTACAGDCRRLCHGVLRTAVVTHDCAGVTNGRWAVRLAKRVDARTMRLGMGEQTRTRKDNNTKCYLFCLESKASKSRRNLGEFEQVVGGEGRGARSIPRV